MGQTGDIWNTYLGIMGMKWDGETLRLIFYWAASANRRTFQVSELCVCVIYSHQWVVHSGKRLQHYGKIHQFSWENSLWMAMFNSYFDISREQFPFETLAELEMVCCSSELGMQHETLEMFLDFGIPILRQSPIQTHAVLRYRGGRACTRCYAVVASGKHLQNKWNITMFRGIFTM